MHRREFTTALVSLLSTTATNAAVGSTPVGDTLLQHSYLFDFTTDKGRQGWLAAHDISRLTPRAEGLGIVASGDDPYAIGPPVRVPTGQPLWLELRIKAPISGTWQVFYFAEGSGPTEPNSVRFPVGDGDWQKAQVPLPALPEASAYRFRIDPPAGKGLEFVVGYMDLSTRTIPKLPADVPRPSLKSLSASGPVVRVGEMEIRADTRPGALDLLISGERFALGHDAPLIGYQTSLEDTARWLRPATEGKTTLQQEGATLRIETTLTDPQGATWRIEQRIRPQDKASGIQIETTLRVSQDRIVNHFPFLVLLPGAGEGSFGKERGQGLFSGLEYLEAQDTSSSEADLFGPEAKRFLPSGYKVTVPLMAIQAKGRWLGLAWEPSPVVAAAFDSPDRHFGSEAHAIGLFFPGAADLQERPIDELLPYLGRTIRANQPVTVRATLFGGRGESVVDAVKAYVALRGLPPLPEPLRIAQYSPLFVTGWQKSGVRVPQAGGSLQFRHAYPGDFSPNPAPDAAACLDWLAGTLEKSDAETAKQLRASAEAALKAVPVTERNFAGVGHIRTPAPALAYGGMAENLRRRLQEARGLFARFEPDGSVLYSAPPNRPDYGKTHWVKHANGLTGQPVESILEAAALTGDAKLTEDAIALLRKVQTLYKDTVPRGAQTWEVPLHTPDILASAHLTRAFVLGYELTGEAGFLETAKYWAWTGVPFVYLMRPSQKPVGLYGTTPVLGATNWEAPVWIGLPVQWCGLVYANALYDLMEHDPSGPWRQLADGIVVSGAQQTWPVGSNAERQGLLPDSFHPVAQARNDVAINPATLQVPMARAIGKPMYARLRLSPGVFVHAPGSIKSSTPITNGKGKFVVQSWVEGEYTVLVTGQRNPSGTVVNGKKGNIEYHPNEGWMLICLRGTSPMTIEIGA